MSDSRPGKVGLLVLFVLVILVAVHQMPFLSSIYRVPNDDYSNVMSVVHQVRTPDVFQNNPMLTSLASLHVTTAPLYYYGLAYPLSLVFIPGRTSRFFVSSCI